MTIISDNYIETWNAVGAERDALLAEHWNEAATYTDPLTTVEGHDAIRSTIEAVQAQFPGHQFTVLGPTDAHHNLARFQWGLGIPNEELAVIGFDVIELDDTGRIRGVAGFIDRVGA